MNKSYAEFIDESQEYTSAKTSQSQIAGGFKKVNWKAGDINLDYGGGKYDKATDYLARIGVINLVYDPFNRSSSHNNQMLEEAKTANISTCFNVLNVIKEPEARKKVLKELKRQSTDTIYITVYVGDRSSEGKVTTKGWQNHAPLKWYLDEVKAVYGSASIKKDMIVVKV